jgi:hypothetical protein
MDRLLILKNIGQCYIKHIMTLLIKTIKSFLKDSTYIITYFMATESYWAHHDTNDNVCLDLYNYRYSIYVLIFH